MLSSWLLMSVFLAPAAPTPKSEAKFEWPQWRGPNRDGVSPEKGLLKEWPKDGPKKDWTVDGCGGGYSSVSIVGGMIYGTGTKNNQETIWCRNESDGKEVWSTPFGDAKKVGYGEGVRSTPTFHKDKLYCLGVGGELVCVNAKDGKILWQKNHVKDFGGSVQAWGYSESVLIDGDKVITAPGSAKAAVVALKAESGELIWQTPVTNPGGAQGYSSAVKTTVNKKEIYLVMLGKKGGVIAVDAKTGKLYAQYDKIMNGTANIPTPVVRDDLMWCSTGYQDGGSALVKIVPDGDGFKFEELKYYDSKTLQNHHGGMILVGEYVFLGNRHNSGIPACVEFKTGEIKWKESQGAGGGGGSGSLVYADGMLYFNYENGTVALVVANPEKFELKGSFKIPQKSNKPNWAHPVVVNGHLYLRDQDKLHCFDVRQ